MKVSDFVAGYAKLVLCREKMPRVAKAECSIRIRLQGFTCCGTFDI